jgi:hypothetical protein
MGVLPSLGTEPPWPSDQSTYQWFIDDEVEPAEDVSATAEDEYAAQEDVSDGEDLIHTESEAVNEVDRMYEQESAYSDSADAENDYLDDSWDDDESFF